MSADSLTVEIDSNPRIATRKEQVGRSMLGLFIIASMIVPLADALGPGHILDHAWNSTEVHQYIWLWMLSWVTMPYCLYVVTRPNKFQPLDLFIAFMIPFIMWIAQLWSVALYWIDVGVDPFPNPVNVHGIRIDWPGAVVNALFGAVGFYLARDLCKRNKSVQAYQTHQIGKLIPALKFALITVIILTIAYHANVFADLWYTSARDTASLHGLFHFSWASWNLAMLPAFVLVLVSLCWSSLARPIITLTFLTLSPWLAYILIPLPIHLLSHVGH